MLEGNTLWLIEKHKYEQKRNSFVSLDKSWMFLEKIMINSCYTRNISKEFVLKYIWERFVFVAACGMRDWERIVAPFHYSRSKHFNIISMHDVLLRRTWESILLSDMTSQNGYFGILLHLLSQEAKNTARNFYKELSSCKNF